MKFKSDIEVQAGLKDSSGALGLSGQILSSTSGNVSWVTPTVNTVARDVQNQVKAGVAINKGQAVYVTGADGTNIIVGLASNVSEATSSKTLGLLNATVATNGFADVVQIGRLSGLNTIGAVVGDPVWLGTGGNLIYGLTNKPYAPAHLVFIGVVTRVNANNGEIFITVQNGFELKEIHDVDIITTVPINGDVLGYDGTLWVNKTIAQWLGFTPANASGTTNYVSKFTGTTTLGNSQIYDNGTNVGIGTVTPSEKLEVNGTTKAAGFIFNASAGLGQWQIGSDASIDAGRGLYIYNTLNGYNLNITQGGNVGVGATSPFSRMEIVGAATSWASSPAITFTDDAGTVNSRRWLIGNVATDYGSLNFAVSTTNSDNPSNPKMTITKEGNVGIGTTTPVSIGSYTSLDLRGTNGSLLYMGQAGATASLRLIGEGTDGYIDNINISGSLLFRTNAATERMRITLGGNVGIGTSTPAYKLDVNGGGAFRDTLRVVSSGTDVAYLSWTSANTGVLSLLSGGSVNAQILASGNSYFNGGNVGIGTASPSQKLEVSGTALINGVLNSYATMDNLARRFNSPEGGSYITSSSSVTGAIKIKLPIARNNSATMMMFTVKIYQYSTGLAQEFQIAGYNYNAGGWYNPSVTNLSDSANNFTIRFGADATSDCVWIGETSSTWTYPQVFVTDFQAGYNGQSIDWATGWNVSFQSSFDTVELSRVASQVLTTNNISSFGITGSGTTNYVPKFTGATSLGNSLIYDNGSSLGIGSTTTSIIGTSFRTVVTAADNRVVAFNGSGSSSVWWSGSDTPQFAIDSMSGGGAAFWVNNGSWSERMRLTSAGNFGIGTSSPSGKLDVYGDGYFGKQDYSYQAIQKVLTLRGDPISGVYAENSYRFYTTPGALNSAQKLSIRAEYAGSESSDLMTILGSGNVGIGTSSPSQKLEVNGNIFSNALNSTFEMGNGSGSYGSIGFNDSTNTVEIKQKYPTGNITFITNTSSERMRITSAGDVAIGTTAALLNTGGRGNVTINGSYESILVLANGGVWKSYLFNDGVGNTYLTSAGVLNFGTNGSDRMRIDNSGNVGIGTTSPSYKLDIYDNTVNGFNFKVGSGYYNRGVKIGTHSSNVAAVQGIINDTGVYANLLLNPDGGNIGIGTTSPIYTLDVNGTSNITNSLLVGGNLGVGTTMPITKVDIVDTMTNPTLRLAYVPMSGYGGGGNIDFVGGSTDYVFGAISWKNGTTVQGQVDYSGFGRTMTLTSQQVIAFRTSLMERMRIDSMGQVGIGTSAPMYTLHVNGSVAGTSAYINLSDERYKKDILPIENALDKVLSLNGVTFNWNKEFNPETNLDDTNHIGLIAQEVEKIIPQAVSTASDDNQTKSVAYSDLVPVLIEAIKEQQKQIEELKKLINK